MVAIQLIPQHSGPRPLNLARDLSGVADLLEIAFRNDLDANGRQMIHEARMMSRIGPLLFIAAGLFRASAGLSPGFVWDDGGRIVGNVTIMQSQRRPSAWQIANVAVLPEHRRRGVATELMQAAIDHIRRQNGRTISLQVKDSNSAIRLYDMLGFESLGAVTLWQSGGHLLVDKITTTGRSVRPARIQDTNAIWHLFHSVTPAAQGWPDPLTARDFHPNFGQWLGDLLMGRQVQRWVIAGASGNVDGFVECRTQPAAHARLVLRNRAAAAGQIEGDLLSTGLRYIQNRTHHSILVDHPAGDIPAERRLREAGFHAIRTLIMMQLKIKP